MKIILKLVLSAALLLGLPALALVTSDTPNFKKMMTFTSNSQAKDAELKPVLTADQYSQYEQKKSELEAQVKAKLKEKHQAAQASQ